MLEIHAHRGMYPPILAHENTIEAISNACEDPNIHGIEIDIQMTKDGVFVCTNYPNLKDILKQPYQKIGLNYMESIHVEQLTYDELMEEVCILSVGLETQYKKRIGCYETEEEILKNYYDSLKKISYKIPKLEEVLKIVFSHGKHLQIEIKKSYEPSQKKDCEDYVKRLYELCKSCGSTKDNTIFISRYQYTIDIMREHYPEYKYYPIIGYEETIDPSKKYQGLSVAVSHLNVRTTPLEQKPLVSGTNETPYDYAEKEQLDLSVWNPLTSQEMQQLEEQLGRRTPTTIITTSHPNCYKQKTRK